MTPWQGAALATAVQAALANAPALPAQQNLDTVQVRTERVADVGPDRAFLVDDQYAPLTPKILAAIRGITDQPVRFVLNTHWHGDHTGGNENLGRTGTVIVAHDNVRRRMSATHVNEFFKSETPASPAGALPVVTFNDSVTFHLDGEEIRTHHVRAAHTDGDAGLRRYHDMLVTVRDRIGGRKRAGASLADVKAARPTAEFDAAWGQAFIKPDQFVELVYRTVGTR